METVLIKQGKQAEVLIYFAGHGFVAGKSEFEQQGYLATYDSKLQQEQGELVSAEGSLPFVFLNGLIEKAELAGLAVFLDCCQSEYVIDQALLSRGLRGFQEKEYFLSAACRGFAPAYEESEGPHGVYTGALRKALVVEKADQQTGEVSAADAHSEVVKQLKGKKLQTPVQFGFGNSFSVVRYRQASAPESVGSEECPYQGLEAFTRKTAEFFFGRDADVRELLKKLNDSNFVPVLGPSGSGKSSVVRAGLVTRLAAQGWLVVTMKPDDEPMANLKVGLRRLFEAEEISRSERNRWVRTLSEDGLLAMEGQLPEDWRVLVVVDQFEEVFTLCDKETQRRFVGELVKVGRATKGDFGYAQSLGKGEGRKGEGGKGEGEKGEGEKGETEEEAARLAVVVTMRSDFVDDWLRVGQPPEVIRHDTVWLGPLVGENLRAAIVEPARRQRYEIGPVLLDLLLTDVEQEENCLPLLEFALWALWEKRDTEKRELTAVAYVEMGRLKGALNRQAEKVYGNLRAVDQEWARRICLQLVRIGRGEKDTRQRQPKERLLAMGGKDVQARETIAAVIQDLVDGRLLVSSGEDFVVSDRDSSSDAETVAYVDLAHEALLEGWQQFAVWRQEDRALRRLIQRMGDEYESWKQAKGREGKNEDDYLLKGGLLAEVREQREALSKELGKSRPALMQYFADSDQKDEENVAVLKQALADADMRAASLKVRDKLLNNPAQTVDAALSAMALVGQSQEAFQGAVVYPAQDALHRAWFKIRERLEVEGHSGTVLSVAFSPQGDRIVSGSDDQTLRLWRVGTWEDELRYCCNTLMHHTALTLPQSETASKVCAVCEQVWTRQQSAEFAVAQGCALARKGEVDAAVAKFEEAQKRDESPGFDARETAMAISEQRFRGFDVD